ncbi:hypothetical protein [Streptomyces formicae]|uniref:Uncharacterized protein n=1 Tax=Streptomyces formicae TaxID=1616117 RepID=A0ABY3WHR3_9ACTN|nr:hypothetical protein [Streptomyces formicae]UNM12136.1 hypothetical protein J4032_11825 [Streptomyces formicae]
MSPSALGEGGLEDELSGYEACFFCLGVSSAGMTEEACHRAIYAIAAPHYPLLRRLPPNQVTSTERLGRAMIAVAADGAPHRLLGTREINSAAAWP